MDTRQWQPVDARFVNAPAPRRHRYCQVAAALIGAFTLGAIAVLLLGFSVLHGSVTTQSLERSVAQAAGIALDPEPPFAGGTVHCRRGDHQFDRAPEWTCDAVDWDESGGRVAQTYRVQVRGSCWTGSYSGETEVSGEGRSLERRITGCVPLLAWN